MAFDEAILEQVPSIRQPMPRDHREEELHIALEGIPRDYALALRLHFLDDMPLKRIAGYLGVSLATVKWRIHHGKKLLRDQFEVLRQGSEKWKGKKK